MVTLFNVPFLGAHQISNPVFLGSADETDRQIPKRVEAPIDSVMVAWDQEANCVTLEEVMHAELDVVRGYAGAVM